MCHLLNHEIGLFVAMAVDNIYYPCQESRTYEHVALWEIAGESEVQDST
jgi:hypothetical protein